MNIKCLRIMLIFSGFLCASVENNIQPGNTVSVSKVDWVEEAGKWNALSDRKENDAEANEERKQFVDSFFSRRYTPFSPICSIIRVSLDELQQLVLFFYSMSVFYGELYPEMDLGSYKLSTSIISLEDMRWHSLRFYIVSGAMEKRVLGVQFFPLSE